MTNRYFPIYADYAAAAAAVTFPASAMTPLELFDKSTNHGQITVTFTVPANLSMQAPAFLGLPTVTVGGNARTLVRGTGPAQGQVGYDDVMGFLYFHSTDLAGAASAVGYPLMTIRTAAFLHRLEAELIATQEELIAWIAAPGQCGVLATVTGIDGKVAATTNLLVATANYVIERIRLRVTAVTAISANPTVGAGVAAGEDDVVAPVDLSQFTALSAIGQTVTLEAGMFSKRVANGETLKLGIDTGATGTTLTFACDVVGYEIA